MAETKDAAQTRTPCAVFARQLRNPINEMPPYPHNLLSDRQGVDIDAFLQGVPGWRPVKDTPIFHNNY